MQKLVQGIHHFKSDVFEKERELWDDLAKGQSPETLMICCSDSRVDPIRLTQSGPGELFMIQNAGNIVPPLGAPKDGVHATIEYAVVGLKVKHIVVCGHSKCGAMTALINPDSLSALPYVGEFLQHSAATKRIIDENYKHITDADQKVMATVEENVLVQLEHLKTLPSVAAALARNELELHGWVYKFEAGEVYAYDPKQQQFTLLGDTNPRG